MDPLQARELPFLNPVAALVHNLKEVAERCQQILADNPRDAKSLATMALVGLASGQFAPAVRMAHAAVEADPAMVPAWVVLGQALKADGNYEVAAMAYREALTRDPHDPMAQAGYGELLIATNNPDEADRAFELALRQQPHFTAALVGRGHALACLERFAEALEHYERALAVEPRLPEAEFAAGFALERMRQLDQAEHRYRRSLALNPNFSSPWINLGNLLREKGRDLEAEAALKQAIQLKPSSLSAWINLALLARERRQFDQTEICLRKAFALNPGQVEMLIAWCQFRLAERDLPGAWGWLRWALAADPGHAECENMRGILLHNEGRFDEAIAAFEKADAMGHRVACANRGNTLIDLGRLPEAIVVLERAVERNPGNAGTLYNLALTRLRHGDWRQGWLDYEARWGFREVHRLPRHFNRPRWKGEPLHGQRVLLHAEQGLGDTIQFCRFAQLVADRGGFPVLEVQPPTCRLLQSLALVRSYRAELALIGEKHPPFDLECPLMSLPAVFGTTIDSVPWNGPYLAADPGLVRQRIDTFPELANDAPSRPLRIGLAWAGNPSYRSDHHRSTRLARLLPLLRLAGIHWFALQKGPAAEQIVQLSPGLTLYDGSSNETDLADTAALIDRLDLVVTTDTSIVHLAGALGKPVWVMLPHLADWRWMNQRSDTPWYPTVRLFRQRTQGDWSELVSRIAAELVTLSRSQGPALS